MDRYQQLKFLRFFLETYWNDPGLAFWRAKEAALISQAEFLFPMLDLGCADGLFLKALERGKPIRKGCILGIDLRQEALEISAKADLYKSVIRADVAHLPFKKGTFNYILSNCVLEHVQLLDQALGEAARVASSGSHLVFTVPDMSFGENILPVRIARFFRQQKAAHKYKDSVNADLGHVTCQNKEWWEQKLQDFGFKINYYEPYLSTMELFVWFIIFYAVRFKINRFNGAGILNYIAGRSGRFLGGFLKSAFIFVSFVIFSFFLSERCIQGNALFIVAEKNKDG